MQVDVKEREVFGLYADSWKDIICEDAFAHPAKYARGMIRWIVEHALEQGYIRPGETLLDPFAGVALGAHDLALNGVNWLGVELEEKFVKLGRQNIERWERLYRPHFPDMGRAVIVQGDSRRLTKVVQGAAAVLSSPPYAASVNQSGAANDAQARKERKREAGVPDESWHEGGPNSQQNRPQMYGDEDGQLGSMPEGQFDAALSSPPYGRAVDGSGEGPGARFDDVHHAPDNARKQSSDNGYGETPGQLGAMADGVVSSPPFESSVNREGEWNNSLDPQKNSYPQNRSKEYVERNRPLYGDHPANIGNDTGATFWTAARAILEQTFAVLKPGGVAIWITGDYVRDGQRVHFGRQWAELCAAVGFVPVERIVAWKVESGPTQLDIWGNGHEQRTERLSFFRRLANKRAREDGREEAVVENEDVWIVRKPAANGDTL